MLVHRAYKVELDLNNAQDTACKQHAGAARWGWNWGVQRKQDEYRKTGTSPLALALHRELNALKQTDVPWMYDVSKCAPQEARRNLDVAFSTVFRRVQLKQAGKQRGTLGDPTRKSRKKGRGSFRLTGCLASFPETVQLPRRGHLRVKEPGYLPTRSEVKVLSATVRDQGGRWYVSVLVEQDQARPENTGPVGGVDLGVKRLATLSDGDLEENPRQLTTRLTKLKRLPRVHRAVTRKLKGRQHRQKAARQLGAAYRTGAHLRATTWHHLPSRLAKTKSVVVIEDLNVAGMLKNHHLAQAIADGGGAEFRRHLEYKVAWYGGRVIVADRWFTSSRTCSCGGWVHDLLELSDRVFICHNPARPDCGLVMDRDLNAAINVAQLADRSADSRNACGEGSAGLGGSAQVKLPSLKQEPDTFYPHVG